MLFIISFRKLILKRRQRDHLIQFLCFFFGELQIKDDEWFSPGHEATVQIHPCCLSVQCSLYRYSNDHMNFECWNSC